MTKCLVAVLKDHVKAQKQASFKQIKKVFKERQLQIYIRRKQNEFALKSAVIVKVDSLICQKNGEMLTSSFQTLKEHFLQLKR
jgi:hypothetical protein